MGNPQAYNNGTVSNQKFFRQHNAYWIEAGFPYANQIMVFNNGNGRTGGNYSTVEIIDPPVSGYTYSATLPYLPTSNSWIYNAGNPNSFYAQNISGAQQLSNGNVIIANGPAGIFTEIDATGIQVWKYVNPVSGTGIIAQNATPTQNLAFRCSSFYPSNYSGFVTHSLTSSSIIESTNTVSATCVSTLGVNDNFIDNQVVLFPNPANTNINVDCKKGYQIFSITGTLIKQGSQNTQTIDISELPEGMYILKPENKVARFIKAN